MVVVVSDVELAIKTIIPPATRNLLEHGTLENEGLAPLKLLSSAPPNCFRSSCFSLGL